MFDSEDWLPLVVIAFTLSSILLLTLPSSYGAERRFKRDLFETEIRVQVVVLGDVGRSPRIQYHALSIAKNGGLVDLIGYKGRVIPCATAQILLICTQYPSCIPKLSRIHVFECTT